MTDISNLAPLIQLRRELKGDVEDLREQIEAIDATIKERLGDSADGMVDGVRMVHWTYDTPRVFNLTLFKMKHPDLYEAFREESERRRFIVSEGEQS